MTCPSFSSFIVTPPLPLMILMSTLHCRRSRCAILRFSRISDEEKPRQVHGVRCFLNQEADTLLILPLPSLGVQDMLQRLRLVLDKEGAPCPREAYAAEEYREAAMNSFRSIFSSAQVRPVGPRSFGFLCRG